MPMLKPFIPTNEPSTAYCGTYVLMQLTQWTMYAGVISIFKLQEILKGDFSANDALTTYFLYPLFTFMLAGMLSGVCALMMACEDVPGRNAEEAEAQGRVTTAVMLVCVNLLGMLMGGVEYGGAGLISIPFGFVAYMCLGSLIVSSQQNTPADHMPPRGAYAEAVPFVDPNTGRAFFQAEDAAAAAAVVTPMVHASINNDAQRPNAHGTGGYNYGTSILTQVARFFPWGGETSAAPPHAEVVAAAPAAPAA